jgi:hypothetical protein
VTDHWLTTSYVARMERHGSLAVHAPTSNDSLTLAQLGSACAVPTSGTLATSPFPKHTDAFPGFFSLFPGFLFPRRIILLLGDRRCRPGSRFLPKVASQATALQLLQPQAHLEVPLLPHFTCKLLGSRVSRLGMSSAVTTGKVRIFTAPLPFGGLVEQCGYQVQPEGFRKTRPMVCTWSVRPGKQFLPQRGPFLTSSGSARRESGTWRSTQPTEPPDGAAWAIRALQAAHLGYQEMVRLHTQREAYWPSGWANTSISPSVAPP